MPPQTLLPRQILQVAVIAILMISPLQAAEPLHGGTFPPERTAVETDIQLQLESTQAQLADLQAQLDQLKQQTVGTSGVALSSHLQSSVPGVDDPSNVSASEASEFSTLSKDFQALSSEWKKFQKDEAKKRADAAKKPTFQIGGRIQLYSWSFMDNTPGIGYFENPSPASSDYGEDPQDRISFRRIRLEIQGDIFETMLYRLQVDFADPATPAFKDVYAGFKELPGDQMLLIGNQKRPLGLDALESSRFTVFMERPMINDAFNENARRIGAAMYGGVEDQSLNWCYGLFTLVEAQTTGGIIDDALQSSFNARLFGAPWYDDLSDGRGYLHLAVAGMFAKPNGDNPSDNAARFRTREEARTETQWLDTGKIAGADWYEVMGLESILNVGAFQLTGEYMTTWVQRDNNTIGTGPDLFFHGGYLYASYFLTGEYHPYEKNSGTIGRVKPFENFFLVSRCNDGLGHGWGAWEVAARFSYLNLNSNDINGGVGYDSTFALNWYWTSHSKLQMDLSYADVRDHVPVAGYTSGQSWTLGTRLAVDF